MATDDRTDGNDEDVEEFMAAEAAPSWVGEIVEVAGDGQGGLPVHAGLLIGARDQE